MAYEISTRAFDYAKDAGLDKLASMGAGPEFMNRFVAAKAASLRPQLSQARFQAGHQTMSRLGEGTMSGQFGAARAAVDAFGFGRFAEAIRESEAANEQIRTGAETQWMNILMDLDSREQSAQQHAEQLEAQEGHWFDRALGVASIFV